MQNNYFNLKYSIYFYDDTCDMNNYALRGRQKQKISKGNTA